MTMRDVWDVLDLYGPVGWLGLVGLSDKWRRAVDLVADSTRGSNSREKGSPSFPHSHLSRWGLLFRVSYKINVHKPMS